MGVRLAPLLLLLVLSVGDDVTQVLVVQVASDVQGEVGEHVLDLAGVRVRTTVNTQKKVGRHSETVRPTHPFIISHSLTFSIPVRGICFPVLKRFYCGS